MTCSSELALALHTMSKLKNKKNKVKTLYKGGPIVNLIFDVTWMLICGSLAPWTVADQISEQQWNCDNLKFLLHQFSRFLYCGVHSAVLLDEISRLGFYQQNVLIVVCCKVPIKTNLYH